MVNAVDLSSHAFNVDTPSDKEQVDVSGFSPTGTREYLPGMADQSIDVQFENDFAATSVHATLQPLFANGTTFTVYVAPDATAPISATNPAYGGTGTLFDYNGLVRCVERTVGDDGDVQAGTRVVVPVGRRRPDDGEGRDRQGRAKAA